ncbi:CPBP family intramembrane metalloprotease [Pedobacter riviphilus]|uniref:CPBP family intramembrane metalloprotease n=1 Tax=Pedobacter riviphilus TaxID=2766984 RepID=A0ABX6TN56_9SPHI|nr:type II CAAX endopeptidase family protein [Pedobacter riviphilus]QNR86004.1 CPBP family intramembrane metalloprotease [Pedobacter riviphilus]
MKMIANLPPWLKVVCYFLFMFLATVIAGAVPVLNDFIFFFIIALIMSWILLKLENKSLSSLGFWPRDKRTSADFFKGLGIGIGMLIVTFLLTVLLTKDNWKLNSHIDPILLMVTFLMCLWSAFVQEFVFRGYPFQELLSKYRPWLAQLLIAIPFGLMHVNKGMATDDIILVMLSTGAGSVLFGLAYIKTKNLMFPIGIHLGWNYAQELIPRTAGGKSSALVIFNNSHATYNMFNVSFPYFLVIVITIIVIWKIKKPLGQNRAY